MQKSKIYLFIILTVFGIIAAVYLDIYDKEFNVHDIIIAFHGLIFDLILFGLILTIYDSIKSRRDNISRYQEEIQDYSGWAGDEAKYRNKGLIKRLISLKAKKVELHGCYIKNCPYTKKMTEWSFTSASLYDSIFIGSDLSKSDFHLSNLYNTYFIDANITECKFNMAILDNCVFRNCKLSSAKFDFAYVKEKDWFNKLQQDNNIGVDTLINKYVISTNSIIINSIKYYQIIDKVYNSTVAVERDVLMLKRIQEYKPKIIYRKIKKN